MKNVLLLMVASLFVIGCQGRLGTTSTSHKSKDGREWIVQYVSVDETNIRFVCLSSEDQGILTSSSSSKSDSRSFLISAGDRQLDPLEYEPSAFIYDRKQLHVITLGENLDLKWIYGVLDNDARFKAGEELSTNTPEDHNAG